MEMWVEQPQQGQEALQQQQSGSSSPTIKVIFRTWVVEREVLAIANAAVELRPPAPRL